MFLDKVFYCRIITILTCKFFFLSVLSKKGKWNSPGRCCEMSRRKQWFLWCKLVNFQCVNRLSASLFSLLFRASADSPPSHHPVTTSTLNPAPLGLQQPTLSRHAFQSSKLMPTCVPSHHVIVSYTFSSFLSYDSFSFPFTPLLYLNPGKATANV